ncbi:MAG: tetratricopeptide repeat protein [Porphyromonas sp.]|uniref:tetratricopeptide repeat protein n=1 Tax=Porphyromonas sp. TaxID=1924944 RepID=UPI001A50F691|nr:tetratricopeptide repeat protein [Porphyromonas sp.]MBL6452917.1 tetratricopeptide repeat protein [Porphyromonas sp.]
MGLFSRFKKSNKKSPVSTEEVEQETTDVTQEVAEQATEQVSEPKANTLKADTLKFDALRALKIGEVDFAIRALRTSLEEIDDPECRLYLAQALQRKPDLAGSMAELTTILETYPDYPAALYEATKVSNGLDQHSETIAYAEHALATELETAQQAELHRMKAQAQLALSESEQALATIDQALQLTDEVPLYWLIKVKVLIALERWADALAVTLETAEKFPEEERAYLYEGLIAYHEGDKERAERAFRQVVETDPFNVEGYMHLTHLVEELRGEAAAADEMEQALEMIPQPTRALLEYATSLYKACDRTEQYEGVQQLLADLPEEAETKAGEVNFANLYAGGFY